MSTRSRVTRATGRRYALAASLLLAWPLAATAQNAPESSSSAAKMDMAAMPGMDQANMAGMDMSGAAVPETATKPKKSKRPTAPAPAKSIESMPGMDAAKPPAAPASSPSVSTDGMPGMDAHAMKVMGDVPAAGSSAPGTDDMPGMPGMTRNDKADASPQVMKGMEQKTMPAAGSEDSMPGMTMDSMPGMTMGQMQGGKAPADARSPDYSDGVGYGSMKGMDMADSAPRLGMLQVDQLEAFDGKNGSGQRWEAQGWYGNDSNKLWVRTEGTRSDGRLEEGDVEAFWNHSVSTYWGSQIGVRHDLGQGPTRNWAAGGFQGISPYWFDVEATAYVGPSNRTAARFRAEYDVLFTQKLILQPEFETNFYGKSDPQRRLGSGLSDAQLGFRLRYEIRREFAPYIGVSWVRRFGATANFARDDHQAIFDRQWVAGIRVWF